jgi:hypothetical protein
MPRAFPNPQARPVGLWFTISSRSRKGVVIFPSALTNTVAESTSSNV